MMVLAEHGRKAHAMDIKHIEHDVGTPLMDELVNRSLLDVVIPTADIVNNYETSGICPDGRLEELADRCIDIDKMLIEQISDSAKNKAEYYMMLGQIATDLCMTFMLEYQRIVAMEQK